MYTNLFGHCIVFYLDIVYFFIWTLYTLVFGHCILFYLDIVYFGIYFICILWYLWNVYTFLSATFIRLNWCFQIHELTFMYIFCSKENHCGLPRVQTSDFLINILALDNPYTTYPGAKDGERRWAKPYFNLSAVQSQTCFIYESWWKNLFNLYIGYSFNV